MLTIEEDNVFTIGRDRLDSDIRKRTTEFYQQENRKNNEKSISASAAVDIELQQILANLPRRGST